MKDVSTKFIQRKNLYYEESRPFFSVCEHIMKQAGTGPSRRHIQGSKIAKRLPSVKYSLLQYSKIENFSKKNFRKNYILKKMDRVAR